MNIVNFILRILTSPAAPPAGNPNVACKAGGYPRLVTLR